jgi:hypothetical protein
MSFSIELKIISGGQTGVDRAALDAAIARGVARGGWCPRGRAAEDGEIPARYPLVETASDGYAERTERNVVHSDATVIFTREGTLSGGTLLTRELAEKNARPVLIIREAADERAAAIDLLMFVRRHAVRVLNVAGPRESQAPGLDGFVKRVFDRVLGSLQQETH